MSNSTVRLPNARLVQDESKRKVPKPSSFKEYPAQQVLYFHEKRLERLEKLEKGGVKNNKSEEELKAVTLKLNHLEALVQNLVSKSNKIKHENTLELVVEEDSE